MLADGNNAIVSPIADVFFSPAFPTTPDQAMQLCQAVDINNLANQFPLFMGAPWLCGQHIFLHVTPPNSRSCGFFVALRAVMPPSSRHPGGVNIVFGDGSVKFIKDSVNLPVWRALGTRAGGEVDQFRQLLSTNNQDIGRVDDDERDNERGQRLRWPGSPGRSRFESVRNALGRRCLPGCARDLALARLRRCQPGARRERADRSRRLEDRPGRVEEGGDTRRRSRRPASPMIVQDFEWESGAKLLDYQLVDDGKAYDANLRIQVKLTLAGGEGKAAAPRQEHGENRLVPGRHEPQGDGLP